MNQYLGIGILTKDPVFTERTENTYCNFTVAVNNRNDDTTFVEVVSYGKQAIACNNHLIKGSQVCFKGIPLVRAFLDGEGNPRANLKVRAREIDFISKLKPRDEAAAAPVPEEPKE